MAPLSATGILSGREGVVGKREEFHLFCVVAAGRGGVTPGPRVSKQQGVDRLIGIDAPDHPSAPDKPLPAGTCLAGSLEGLGRVYPRGRRIFGSCAFGFGPVSRQPEEQPETAATTWPASPAMAYAEKAWRPQAEDCLIIT